MNSNLPIKVEKGLFGKIKTFFRALFYKTNKKVDDIKDGEGIVNNSIQKEEFANSIKIEVDSSVQKELAQKELFNKIVKSPDLLTSLSNEQLEKFIKYGNQVIQKNNEIISMKKAEISKFKKVS